MKKQSAEYYKRIGQQIELQSIETVTEYLTHAISDDNSVLITAKESASDALTEQQRKHFSELGLEKLSTIDTNESYLAVIGPNGKILKEEKAEEGKGSPISYKGSFGGGISYKLMSGGLNDGDIAYCQVRKDDFSLNERGLNIVVFNHEIGEVVDSAAFDTDASRSRDVYSINKPQEVAALTDDDAGNRRF